MDPYPQLQEILKQLMRATKTHGGVNGEAWDATPPT
jgi:hypothetical protein